MEIPTEKKWRQRRSLVGAWIETLDYKNTGIDVYCRSLVGAWIETSLYKKEKSSLNVAP